MKTAVSYRFYRLLWYFRRLFGRQLDLPVLVGSFSPTTLMTHNPVVVHSRDNLHHVPCLFGPSLLFQRLLKGKVKKQEACSRLCDRDYPGQSFINFIPWLSVPTMGNEANEASMQILFWRPSQVLVPLSWIFCAFSAPQINEFPTPQLDRDSRFVEVETAKFIRPTGHQVVDEINNQLKSLGLTLCSLPCSTAGHLNGRSFHHLLRFHHDEFWTEWRKSMAFSRMRFGPVGGRQ